MRGQDWKWDNQDGGQDWGWGRPNYNDFGTISPSFGTVTNVWDSGYDVAVTWDNDQDNNYNYRMGFEGKYDLNLEKCFVGKILL